MKVLSKIFTALVFLFLYAPLIIMVIFSFNSGKSTSVFMGFSTKWYQSMFSSSQTVTALQNTLILALCSAAIATVLGTLAAVGIYNMRSLSFFTILIAHITFNLPYVILNVLPKLRQTSGSLTEAALDLGCTPVKAFFKVVLPNISSGIFSGFLMSFTLSLDDFVISYYTNGADFQTLPLMIYSMTKKKVKPDMYAISSLIFFSVLILLIAINLFQMHSEKSKAKKEQ